VRYTFRIARYLCRFLLAFTPPLTRWKAQTWALIVVLVAILAGGLVWVNINVTGTRPVDDEVRWGAYIGTAVIWLLGFIPTASGNEDSRSRRLDFYGGSTERAVVVDYQFAVSRDGKWMGFRLVAAHGVYRLLGVAAIELADHRFLCVPTNLFPGKREWRDLEANLSSRD
jgi:hypothetical protein